MAPFNVVAIVVITLLVAIPWLVAFVLAVKDISRSPSVFTYAMAVIVALGSAPVAFVYLAYRVWRGDAATVRRSAA